MASAVGTPPPLSSIQSSSGELTLPPEDRGAMMRKMAGWAAFGCAVRAYQLGIQHRPLRSGELRVTGRAMCHGRERRTEAEQEAKRERDGYDLRRVNAPKGFWSWKPAGRAKHQQQWEQQGKQGESSPHLSSPRKHPMTILLGRGCQSALPFPPMACDQKLLEDGDLSLTSRSSTGLRLQRPFLGWSGVRRISCRTTTVSLLFTFWASRPSGVRVPLSQILSLGLAFVLHMYTSLWSFPRKYLLARKRLEIGESRDKEMAAYQAAKLGNAMPA